MSGKLSNVSVPWSYYDRFKDVDAKYLPSQGEGENLAAQIDTAVSKLIYKWYNDGDVYDNTYYLKGWANDLSSYANWLATYIPEAAPILSQISLAKTDANYENILKELNDTVCTMEFLSDKENLPKRGSIYNCYGPYKFVEDYDNEEEDDYE